jgi:hypothetical protein
VSIRKLVDPFLAVVAHNLEYVNGQTVVARVFKQRRDGVLDAHDLVAEGIHAHLVGEGQGLAEVLVGFADVEPLTAAVEEGSA